MFLKFSPISSYKINLINFYIDNIINYCYLKIQMLVNLNSTNYKMNNLPYDLKNL